MSSLRKSTSPPLFLQNSYSEFNLFESIRYLKGAVTYRDLIFFQKYCMKWTHKFKSLPVRDPHQSSGPSLKVSQHLILFDLFMDQENTLIPGMLSEYLFQHSLKMLKDRTSHLTHQLPQPLLSQFTVLMI